MSRSPSGVPNHSTSWTCFFVGTTHPRIRFVQALGIRDFRAPLAIIVTLFSRGYGETDSKILRHFSTEPLEHASVLTTNLCCWHCRSLSAEGKTARLECVRLCTRTLLGILRRNVRPGQGC